MAFLDELRRGHPRGLLYLAFTEAWERFSYYGMTALLVLYMVNQVLLPGHVERIAGFDGLRAALESMSGPLTPLALASTVFGLYTGFVYFTPVLGGLVADRWIGQRNAVVLGAVSMSAGHLAMAFDRSFLVALLLLVVGSGLLKGNISAQVGALYPLNDEARRTRGFAIFSMAINFGAVAGPLVCGFLAQRLRLARRLRDRRGFHACWTGDLSLWLSPSAGARAASRARAHARRLTGAEWRTILALAAVMLITIFQSVSYYQLANVLPVWIQEHVDLRVGSLAIPIPWYQSIDALFSILAVPVLFGIWGYQASRRGEPGDLAKIGTGAWLAAASNLILVFAIVAARGAPVHPIWPALYCAGRAWRFSTTGRRCSRSCRVRRPPRSIPRSWAWRS